MCKKLFLIASVLMLVGNLPAMAATRIWDNDDGDNRFDVAANWDTMPGPGDTARIMMIDLDHALIDALMAADVKNIQVGYMSGDYLTGAPGKLLMTGGTLNIGTDKTTPSRVGMRTKGEFFIQGGTVTGDHRLYIGDDPGSDGIVEVSGGSSLDVGKAGQDPGYYGTRTMYVGMDGGKGSIDISGASTSVHIWGEVRVGTNTDKTGTIPSDGTLTMSDGTLDVGSADNARDLRIGYDGGGGTGTISGGTINASGNLIVGDGVGSVGTLFVSSGVINVIDSLQIGINGSTGLVELHGGTIEAGGLEIGPPGSGGTLDFDIGGLLILDGNQMPKVLDLIDDGLFTAFGYVVSADYHNWSYGYNACGYDGKTFVSVPEPATIALLGFGGLALLRSRKKR